MRIGGKNKLAQRALHAIGDRSGSVYILLEEPNHIPLYVSSGIKELTGLDAEEVMADIYSLQWIVTDADNHKGQELFKNWDAKEQCEYEFDFTNIETKEPKHARIILSSSAGTTLIELNDMSAEVEIRNSLKNELEKVKTEERQKSDYLSKMSHEIRTPMNGILGMITLAKNNINNPKEALECLDKANGLSQFLLSLINDILDMSKIERGKVVLEHERFDLVEIFHHLQHMFTGTIEQKGIQFETRMENMEIRYVMGDSLRLTQILINFLSNASKYTERGGKIELVFNEVNRTDTSVHMLFRIKDNGKGMNPEFLSHLFKPFEQEEASTTRLFGGTGLGMAIADNLTNLMGGHIVVNTAPGEGTEFSVYIPLDIAEGDQAWETEENEQTEESQKLCSISGMHILLAEDNAINAEIVSEILAADGVITDTADDGNAVIKMFKESKPWSYDLILMDIQMPNKDGWTAAKEIREIASDYAQKIPIYALSANAFVEDKRHSIEMGMNGHLAKPIDFDNLRKIMSGIRNEVLRVR